MHVRMTQSFGGHAKGQTFSAIPDAVAKAWISRGVAEEYLPVALGGLGDRPAPKQAPKPAAKVRRQRRKQA